MKYKLKRELEMNHAEGRSRFTETGRTEDKSHIFTEMYMLREKYKKNPPNLF